jgi:hypothetical protein
MMDIRIDIRHGEIRLTPISNRGRLWLRDVERGDHLAIEIIRLARRDGLEVQ